MKNLNLRTKETNSRGITLVALIISIVVLLILATVSISLLINEGIIGKSAEAVFRTEIEQYNEELKLAITEDSLNNLGFRDNKFNVRRSSYDDENSFTDAMKVKIPSFNKKYANELEIKEDQLNYIGEDEQERTWLAQVINVAGILKISYVYEDGSKAAPTYQKVITDGSYEVESPKIDGYEPDHYIVSGEIKGDTNITVTYYPPSQGLSYELLSDGTYTVSGPSDYSGEGLVIPEEYEGKEVTQIKANAFKSNNSIKNIILPKNIDKINSECFSFMERLESIYINCKTVSQNSIYFNGSLKDIVIGENVESIAYWGIRNNNKLDNITICSDKVDIDASQFVNSKVSKLKINKENSKYKIVDGVLYSKDGTKIYMYPPEKKGDFEIPSDVKEIGKYAFYYNKYLSEIIIPDSVNIVRNNAFEDCDNINTIYVNAEQICGSVFYSIDKLDKIIIGKNVKRFESWSLRNNNNLKEINYLGTREEWSIINKPNNWKVNDNVAVINCSNGAIDL